jgi:nucleotide-binding universal stress UspA family protein
MKNILVPTDFSDQANFALHFATQIARRTKGKVHLLHIIETPAVHSFNTMGEVVTDDAYNQAYLSARIAEAKKRFSKVDKDPHYRKNNISGEVLIGNPFKHIAEYISKSKSDLVVMGTSGATGLQEALVGSNAEKVVRYSQCPVISLKSALYLPKIKNIVFASDFRNVNPAAVKQVLELLKITRSKLHLVFVNTPNNFEKTSDARKRIESFLKSFSIKKTQIHIYNHFTEEDGILEFARDYEGDIIMMETSGRTGIRHLLSGSIAEDVVNHSPIPVWTFNKAL